MEFNPAVFSTKNECIVSNHTRAPQRHVIGLDMGYSGPKCYHEKGYFVFPNYVEKLTSELVGQPGRDDIVYENLNSGVKYCVGMMAMKSLNEDSVVDEETLFGRNHYLHPRFKITAEVSLGVALWNTPTDGTDVFIQTGLPPAYIVKDTPYLKAVLEGKHDFAVTMGTVRKEFHLDIAPENIDVMKQPMGTFNSIILTDQAQMTPNARSYMDRGVIIFDGGFGTLDKFVVKGGKIVSSSTSPELGMKRILEETADRVRADLGITIPISSMQKILRENKIHVNDFATLTTKTYAAAPYVEEANKIVREEALDFVKDQFSNGMHLVMTGGLGEAWFKFFKEKLENFDIDVIPGNINSNMPVIYSNARGYYLNRVVAERLGK